MKSETIGLIGIGLLGSALAERLLSHYSIFGYDVGQQQRNTLETMGGRAARSASEIVKTCDRIILSLPDSNVVARLIQEVETELQPGTLLIDTTTGAPQQTVQLAEKLASRDVGYVDATVAGSSEQARRGDIVMMAGGRDKDFARCKELLNQLAANVFHVGPPGSGARMKLVVNLVLGLNRAVLAEGLALAETCGIDAQLALDVLKSGAAYSKAMDTKGAKMVTRDFTTQARLSQHLKDVELILELGERNHAKLPLSSVHKQLLQDAGAQGYADADNSAVIMAYQKDE